MSYALKRRAIPPARDPANRGTLEALATAVNELSGTIGAGVDRAVRVGELVEAGVLQLNTAGLLERKDVALADAGPIEIADVDGLQAALDAKQNSDTAWNTSNFNPASKVNIGAAFSDAFAANPAYYNAVSGLDCDNLAVGTRAMVAAANTNCPQVAGVAFWYIETLNSYTGAATVIQRAYSYDAPNAKAMRMLQSGAWTAWTYEWNSGNFDPASKANAVHSHTLLSIPDTRSTQPTPNGYTGNQAQWDFKNTADTGAGGTNWHAILTVSPWTTWDGAHPQQQLTFRGTGLTYRVATGGTTWGAHQNLVMSDDTAQKILVMTETAYNNLSVKDPLTLYHLT